MASENTQFKKGHIGYSKGCADISVPYPLKRSEEERLSPYFMSLINKSV